MKLLIDTQSMLWFAINHPYLSELARKSILNEENDCYISSVSLWEIAIKINIGKLSIQGLSLSEFIDELSKQGFLMLNIRKDHLIAYESLPLIHRDPFDRLILVQAQVEGMAIISSDIAFDEYGVDRIW